ncbi:MAG: sugar phosphate isomerase/epimerase [Salaquimonas sp.]|jgi:sugar phosphate isomerase/epimerase|nr:sugar phosphate isomerase/epimerase [Salaquimonas sp.]
MRLSYQLYSSREFPPLSDTLAMLKRVGYAEVEGFGGLYVDPPGLKSALDGAGLVMTSGHFGLDMLEDEPERAIGIAQTVGMKAVFCPHIAADLRPSDAAGWHAFGARLQKAGEPIRAAGLIYGWHNHNFEFAALPDGTFPMDAILAGGPDLAWQADIAWIVRGGADPLEWIDRYGDRIAAIHIKDIAPAGECVDEDGWADVGQGTMPWPAIFRRVKEKTPAKLFVMEHDKPNDDVRFATRSFEAVNSFGDN